MQKKEPEGKDKGEYERKDQKGKIKGNAKERTRMER
jgi:hypothetical protein